MNPWQIWFTDIRQSKKNDLPKIQKMIGSETVFISQNPSQDFAPYLRVRAHHIVGLDHSYDIFCYLALASALVSTGKVTPSSRGFLTLPPMWNAMPLTQSESDD